jgi:hypothetical protein
MRSCGVGLVRMMVGEEEEGRSEVDMAASGYSLMFLNSETKVLFVSLAVCSI